MDPLERFKARIRAGWERTKTGRQGWIDGSLEIAAALRDARDNMPADIAFSTWLKQNDLAFFPKDDRAALIGLAENIELARDILMNTTSVSYRVIWQENKSRFRKAAKPAATASRKRKKRTATRATTLRTMKLGEETMARIKGTSLDRAEEIDELIMLNRGAPEGELLPIVAQLVADAAAGKIVSARAITAKSADCKAKPSLVDAWRKRMAYAWEMASEQERSAFIEWLMDHIKEGAR